MTEEILTINEFLCNREYMSRMGEISTCKCPYSYILSLLSKNYTEFRASKVALNKYNKLKEMIAIKNIEAFIVKYETKDERNQQVWIDIGKKTKRTFISKQAGLSNCFNFKGDCTKCVYNNYESLKGRCQTYNTLTTDEAYKDIPWTPEILHQPSKEVYDHLVGRSKPIEKLKRNNEVNERMFINE